MDALERLRSTLRESPRRWLLTGVAGFIGSNLLQALLEAEQTVVGLDNFATGHRANLDQVQALVSKDRWGRFRMVEGDVASPRVCAEAVAGAQVVLHQAALGSVPRSIEQPLETNDANVTGQLALMEAARGAGVRRFVYASSSAVYGDEPGLPKLEDRLGRPLSPYAVSKLANELYAGTYGRLHGMETVGLRYFNVFGPRQDPQGAYAAVIPRWISAMLGGEEVRINGTGETSRDFCYVANVVQANLLAATTTRADALNRVYNIALGRRTTLVELYEALRCRLAAFRPALAGARPVHGPFRAGDVLHSLADVERARSLLGYQPTHTLEQGLDESLEWYRQSLGRSVQSRTSQRR